MSKFNTFEDLKAWQACRDLRRFVSKTLIPALPSTEKYRLIDQLLRSSRSTTANIAEGYGRYHYLETIKFCINSRGSCFEVLDHALTANDDDLIDDSMLADTRDLVETCVRIINGYIRFLRREKQGQDINLGDSELTS